MTFRFENTFKEKAADQKNTRANTRFLLRHFFYRRRRIQRTRSTTNNNNKTVVRAAAGKTTPSVETTTTTAVDVAERPMKIVFVSTECAPYSKTGGLGDVVGSLPIELAKRGHKVMSITPRYDQYEGAWDTSVSTTALGEKVGFFHEKKKGVDRVFVDHPLFLAKVWGKTGDKLYGKASGADYADNAKRFALFAKAVLDAPTMLPLEYGEDVVFVCNDWHSSLVPVLLKHECKANGKYVDAKSVMCVHNIAFQGRFWPQPLEELGIPASAADDFFFEDGHAKIYDETNPMKLGEEEKSIGQIYRKMNWLQAGFKNADKCVTVSVNYAKELISGPSKGVELDKVLSAVGIEGIVNGMDPTEWNPAKDKFLDFPYEETTVIEGKACAKQALQAEVGLPIDPEAPLFGYIGRLEEQKGCDIMFEAIPKLIEQIPNAQVVVLGTGKKSMEKMLENLGETMPATNFAGVCKFSAPTAHFINAGADFLMVPSRFEPCGLIQLHAMSYGTVPIVATTGGLVDTVKEGITGYHMGAMDADNLVPEDVEAMVETCVSAAADFGTPAYEKMVKTCIKQDLTWKEPAKKWEALLEELAFGTEESAKKAEVIEPEKLASGIAATTA